MKNLNLQGQILYLLQLITFSRKSLQYVPDMQCRGILTGAVVQCIVPTVKHGGGGVTVWDAMSPKQNLNQSGIYMNFFVEYIMLSVIVFEYG